MMLKYAVATSLNLIMVARHNVDGLYVLSTCDMPRLHKSSGLPWHRLASRARDDHPKAGVIEYETFN